MNQLKNDYIESKYFKIDTKKTFRHQNDKKELFYNILFDKKLTITLNEYDFNLKDKTFRIKLYDKNGEIRFYAIYNNELKNVSPIKAVELIKLLEKEYQQFTPKKWDELDEDERLSYLFPSLNRKTEIN